MPATVPVRQFVSDFGYPEVAALGDEDNLFDKLSIDGDDAFEFIHAFVKTYDVNMNAYRWYFHHGEEGFNPAWLIGIRPPWARVKSIPVTMGVLQQAIDSGRWPIDYPPHAQPKVRVDVLVSTLFVAALLFVAGVFVGLGLR